MQCWSVRHKAKSTWGLLGKICLFMEKRHIGRGWVCMWCLGLDKVDISNENGRGEKTEYSFFSSLMCCLKKKENKKNPAILGGLLKGLNFIYLINLLIHLFIYFVFLGLHPPHMEVPRLGVELELQPMPQPQRRQIWAAHGHTGSLTHWVRSGIEPATSCFLVGFVSVAPQQALQKGLNFRLGHKSLIPSE